MLVYNEYSEPVEKYSGYKNRTNEKFYNRTKKMVSGVMQSSLRVTDKQKLLNEMISIIKAQLR